MAGSAPFDSWDPRVLLEPPFDGREPPDRLTVMTRASRAQLVATVREHEALARATAPGVPVLLLEDVASTDRRCPTPAYGPDDPALVMFTSGSTGAPKGVVLPYAPRVFQAVQWGGVEGITASDRVAQLSSLSYVVGLLRVLVPLVRGAARRDALARVTEIPPNFTG